MRNSQIFLLMILSFKMQTSLFRKFTPSSDAIYPKGSTKNVERFIECCYYLYKRRSCKVKWNFQCTKGMEGKVF